MIFKIECIASGKIYVKLTGYNSAPPGDPVLALSRSRMPVGREIKRLGIGAFRFSELESIDESRQARRRQKFWIKELKSDDPALGWNRPRLPFRYIRRPTTRPGRQQFLKKVTILKKVPKTPK
jgi:hypothetical protein